MATTVNARDLYLQSQTRLLPIDIPSNYNFTGTINNVPAATVTTQANNGNTAYTGTTQYRTDSPPTNTPGGGVAPVIVNNDDGSRDITLAWTYTQGTLPADGFILWYKQGNTTIVTTDPAYSLPATARSYRFMGAHQNTQYRAGIAAYRKTETGYQITAIYQPNTTPSWVVPATATLIGNVPVTTITGNAQAGFDIQQKLEVSGNTILKGVVVPVDSGALKTGTITWNQTTGALAGGSGIAMTEWGLIGAKSGVASFTIESATGNAILAGDLVTGGDVYATGKNLATETYTIGGVAYNVDYSVMGKAESSTTSLIVRAGIVGHAKAVTSKYNIGVLGNGVGATNGIGIAGVGGWFGGWFTADNTSAVGLKAKNTVSAYEANLGGNSFALQVIGPMTINNSTLVTNLNAQKWGGMVTNGAVAVGGGNALTANLTAKKPGTHTQLEWVQVNLADGRVGDIAWWPRA